MATYWSLELYMNPASFNGGNGRFESSPSLQTARSPGGPWSSAASPNTSSHFTVPAGDYMRVAVFDMSNSLTSVQMAAVFGRDDAGGGGASKSSPFVFANSSRVCCLIPSADSAVINGYNAWWTNDWSVQAVTGNYRFLVYVTASDSQGNPWQFGHDPEMDVTSQK